jgi:hypothetical protein
MKEIKKIILTGQVLRPNYEGVIDWFYGIFLYYIKRTTDLPIYVLEPKGYKNLCNNDYIYFDVNKFYSFYGYNNYDNLEIPEKNAIWAKIFYNKEFNREAYEYINSVFKDSLVIVHEIEQSMAKILDYYGITYIDVNTDPIRFLDDQFFAFKSNSEAIYSNILKYKVNEELLYQYASYITVTNRSKGIEETDQNIILFLGQTDCDKSLIDDKTGEIYSILNHKEEFRNAIKNFDKIFYKRHPMVQNDSQVIEYIKSIGDVEIVEDNFYKLMSRRDIKKVVAISSGGCIEAKYFGKQTQILLKNSIELNYENDLNTEKYISVYQDFFTLDFWSKILEPAVITKKFDIKNDFSIQKNKLRNSRGAKCYWGYEDFEQEIVKIDLLSVLNEKVIEQHKINNQLFETITNMHNQLISQSQEIAILRKSTFMSIVKRLLMFLRYYFIN